MSWVKLDDAMGEHRKIKRALRKSRPAVALHFLGILHCSRYLTDGFVEEEYVEEALPAARERAGAVAVLIGHGLWTEVDGGYRIHDYLEHNPTREKVLALRAADAARKARGRGSESRNDSPPVPPESEWTDAGSHAESVRPVPSRPVPNPTDTPFIPKGKNPELDLVEDDDAGAVLPQRPTGNRKRDLAAFDEQVRAYAAARFPDLPEPERAGYTRSAIGQLRNPTHESVEEYVRRWLTPERPAAKEAAA